MSRSLMVAVGGNCLTRAGQQGTFEEQSANAGRVARAVAELVAGGWRVVVTHGNGPQVGAALLRAEGASARLPTPPLDACVAATQGEIGYILATAVRNALATAGIDRPTVALLTHTVVRADDPAFRDPRKPIGPFYSRGAAEEKARELGWRLIEDAGRGYRRVVASPEPLEIVEAAAIGAALAGGALVIALGGGGIPVVREGERLRGGEAVVDKDPASALLARTLAMDVLVFSTDVGRICLDFGTDRERPLAHVTARALARYLDAGHFRVGSMDFKVRAALDFVRDGRRRAVVTAHDRIAAAVRGEAGTHVTGPLVEESP